MADIADLAQMREEEIRAQAIEQARRLMDQDGGQRIKNGRIICTDCGTPIPAGRLRARPGATRCVECQAELEEQP